MKFVEAVKNFTMLAEMRKNFTKFVKFANNFRSSWEQPATFEKSIRPVKILQSLWIGRSD